MRRTHHTSWNGKRILIASHVALCLLLVLPGRGEARTWHVLVDGSGDAPTIQAAINAATEGDEILVHAGTYLAHEIDFMGKELWVHSESGPEQTAIEPDPYPPVFYIHRGEGPGAIIEGFRIGTTSEGHTWGWWGGGIAVENASPTIRDCSIQYLTAEAGGGAACWGSAANVHFERCRLLRNIANVGGGIAIWAGARVELRDCSVSQNFGYMLEGGVAVVDPGSQVTLIRCVISGNYNDYYEGYATGVWVAYAAFARVENGVMLSNHQGEPSIPGCVVVEGATCDITRTVIDEGNAVAVSSSGGQTTVSCSDIWREDGESGTLGVTDGGGNFSADPLFCWLGGDGDFLVRNDSPCLPGNHPDGIGCGVIGLGLGCQVPTPVEVTSWGRIKWEMLDAASKDRIRERGAAPR